MKFPKECAAIVKVAGAKDVRKYIREPYLDVDKARLAATDGACMVLLPVTVEAGDTSGFVSIEAITRAAKAERRRGTASIVASEDTLTADGAGFARTKVADAGAFPDIDRVVPPANPDGPDIALDAALLAKVQAAMGCGTVTLTFGRDADGKIDGTRAIRVEANGWTPTDAPPVGVLMPARFR